MLLNQFNYLYYCNLTLLIQNITIHSIKGVKNLDYEQENDYEQEKNKKLKYSTK